MRRDSLKRIHQAVRLRDRLKVNCRAYDRAFLKLHLFWLKNMIPYHLPKDDDEGRLADSSARVHFDWEDYPHEYKMFFNKLEVIEKKGDEIRWEYKKMKLNLTDAERDYIENKWQDAFLDNLEYFIN